MKKIYLLFLVILLSIKSAGQVQSYSFSQSNGTYQEITGGTSIWTATSTTSFDDSEQNVVIPFSFIFNGVSYTTINVNGNGSIIFPGTTTTSTTTSPISGSTDYAGAISGWGRDINSAYDPSFESSVTYQTIGTTPSRIFVVQFKNVRPAYSSSSTDINLMNFQIRLEETTNVVKIIYGAYTTFSGTTIAASTVQIGLRGATNADFLNRSNPITTNFHSSISGTLNSSTQSFSTDPISLQGMPSNGLTYTYIPSVDCNGTPQGGNVTTASQIVCNGSIPIPITTSYTNPGFKGLTFQWEESDDNGVTDAWISVTGGSGSTTLSYTPPVFTGVTNKYYRLKTTCIASGQSAYSTVHTVFMAMNPDPATNMSFSNIVDSGLTVNWTNNNGNRRVLLINTTNNFTTLSNTSSAAAYVSGTVLSGGDLLIWDGTGSSVNIIGMMCNTTYYFRVYEYLRCGTSPNYGYWHALPLDGSVTTTAANPLLATSLPNSNDFLGFNGTNLTMVFPGWIERTGDGPLTGNTSAWSNSTALSVATANINLYSNTKKDWIVSPYISIDEFSRVKFKAAITDFNNGNADASGMQGTDDKVEVMISSDECNSVWKPLYTFNATTAINLTNILTDYVITIPAEYVGENVRIGFKASEGIDDAPDYDFHLTSIIIENTPPPSVTITKTDNVCFGGIIGSATAVILEGTPPYTYSWSPSGGSGATATGLSSGDYTVTVTDANNLTATASVTITEPSNIVAILNSVNVSCNGKNDGSLTIVASGGTAPYTYLWSTGATGTSLSNLTPGVYSVTITDVNGCTATESITIIEPAILTAISSSQTDVTMYGGNDGSATVSVTGGTAPYGYLWSNGATGLTALNLIAGTYTVTVTDANGCTATQSFTIIQPIPLMVQSVSQTNVSCNAGSNGTATIVAMGGNAPYSYLWSNGATGATTSSLTAGTYTVTVTDSTGNIITESFTITEPLALATTMVKTDISCNFASNGTATVSVLGGTAPYTYFWSNGMTNATATNLNVGKYTVIITDANGCKVTATTSITQPTALVVTPSSTNITCYGLSDGTASVSVTGGTPPYVYSWSNGQTGNSLSSLGKGTYVVTITDANNCTTTQSFTITEPAFVHPPVAVNQSFCIGQNATLANMVITGSNIKWYSAASAGTLLPATTVLTNGTTYYASQTVGTCESATRTAVQITLNQGTPLTTKQLSVCSNSRIQGMIIDGFNYTQLRWYSSATSTVVLPISQLLTTTTYYVSSVVGTCESTRQAIQVTVAATVPAPTAASQVACGNSTLNDLVVTKDPSAKLQWYSSMQSMIPLVGTTQVSTGTYYVQQVIGACESVRIAVAVQVINVSTPTMTSIATCDGNTIADLHPSTGTYVWYVNNTTTTALPDTFVVKSGTYYIAHEVSGCISPRTNVSVNVNARPGNATGQSNQLFGFAARVSDLQMNQPNVSWFASFNDAVKQMNQLAASHPLQDQTTYYGILTGANNCGSAIPAAVTVTINLSNAELDLTQLKYYPNPVDSELNISYFEEIKKVEVFTITGQRVFGNDYQGNEVKVDLSRLSAGTYLVKIETAKASQFVKIVKK